MTFGSLFAGIGGFDLGLEWAGMVCKWQVEIDDYCTKVLEKHWPNVRRYEDVREVGKHNLPPVDLVCGGFPCQPFSSAGKRGGTEDDRWLWPEMFRVIQEVRPNWVFGENTPGIDRMALEQVLSDLESIGYVVAPPLEIPSAAVGTDHIRYRTWILGYSDNKSEPIMLLNDEVSGVPETIPSYTECGDRPLGRDIQRVGRVGEPIQEFGYGKHKNTPGRMGDTDGVSRRVDRLRCLGNAVVPQVVEAIGRAIMEACSNPKGGGGE